MKKNKALLLTLIVFFCTGSSAFSQDLAEDLKNIYEHYYAMNTCSMEMSVDMYSDTGQKTVSQKTEFYKLGQLFLSKMESSEMLITEDNVILLSRENKNILRRKVSEAERELLKKSYQSWQLDSTVLKYDSSTFEVAADGQKKYTVYTPGNVILKTEMWMNSELHAFTKLIYYYNPKQFPTLGRVEIQFVDNTGKKQLDNLFSESRYILQEGNGFKVSPEFQNYQLQIINP